MQVTTTPLCTPFAPQSTSSSNSSYSDVPTGNNSGVQMRLAIQETGIGLVSPTEVRSGLFVANPFIDWLLP